MNYRTQLERLREQFLQVTNESLGKAALLQGAFIVLAAVEDESLPKIDGFDAIANEIRTTKKGFAYVAEIQEYCFAWYAMQVTKNEAFRRMGVTDDTSTFSAMYAAFCLELLDMLEIKVSKDTLIPHPYKLFYLEYIEQNKELRYPEADAAKAYFTLKMDKRERSQLVSDAGSKDKAIDKFIRSFKYRLK